MDKEKKEFTKVTFRVPTELYDQYKIALLYQKIDGRKTPTSDLNHYIKTFISEFERNNK